MAGDRLVGLQTERPRSTRPAPPLSSRTSLKPAFVVLGLAVALVLAFGIGSAVTTGPSGRRPAPVTATPRAEGTGPTVAGTGLVSVPAAGVLDPILAPGTPPQNVLGSLRMPRGARRLSFDTNASSTSQYDRTVDLEAQASQGALLAFFREQLPAKGWQLLSTSPTASHGVELLFQRAGSDGWYWEAALKVAPTSFSSAADRSPGEETTRFSLELVQESDEF